MSDVEEAGTALVKAGPGGKALRPGRGGKVVGLRGRDALPAARPTEADGRAGWPATAQYAAALVARRRSRARRLTGWFALVVILPTLASAAYGLVLASPRYTSSFEFTYQTYRGLPSLASGLVQSVTGTSQTNSVDLGSIVYEYLRSSTLAARMDAALDLRKRFSDPGIDWLSRLGADASRERFLDYFRSHVQVSQGLGGYLKVDVNAYDPALAQTLAQAIVTEADRMVDDLTARARDNEVKFAEAELGRQEDRVRKARTALTAFQNQHGDQDPGRAATQLGDIVGGIEGQLADARTQLANTGAALAPNSPITVQIKARIAALEDQLKTERARLATTDKTGAAPYSQVLDQYASLQLEQEFARNAYTAAQQGVTVARADAATKQNYLVDFIPPDLPQHRSYTGPVQTTAAVFLGSLLAFALGSLVLGAARDQIVG